MELRTVWMEVVRAVRCAVRGGESRRRVPYGMRSEEQPSAWVETEEARARGAQAVVNAPHDLPDLGHLAFNLTGVFRG